MRILFFTLILFALTACTTEEPAIETREPQGLILGDALTEATTQEFRVNDYVQLDDQTLALVGIEDSRCPTDVECYWPGVAKLMFDLNTPEGTQTVYWTLYNTAEGGMEYYYQGETEVTYGSFFMGDFGLAALSLSPYPQAEEGIAQEDYVVELLLHRKLD